METQIRKTLAHNEEYAQYCNREDAKFEASRSHEPSFSYSAIVSCLRCIKRYGLAEVGKLFLE